MAWQPQNYDFKGEVPTAAIIQAYQNKAMQEYQAKAQAEQASQAKHAQVLQTIQMASNLVQQGVSLSAARQQKQAKEALIEEMAKQQTEKKFGPLATNSQEVLKSKFMRAYPETGSEQMAKTLFAEKEAPTAKDEAMTDYYKAQAEFLRTGKPQAPKPDKPLTDVELYEKAHRDALDAAKAANKYGEMTDEEFLPKVKQDALQRMEEMKQLRDNKKLIITTPDGKKAEVTPEEWAVNRAEYLAKGFKVFRGK